MEEVVTLLAESLAKKIAASRDPKAQAELTALSARMASRVRKRGIVPGRPVTAAPTAAPAGVPPPPIPTRAAPAEPAQAFDGNSAAEQAFSYALPTPPPHELLAAFRGGAPLLAGIVLSEALAPPLALREPR